VSCRSEIKRVVSQFGISGGIIYNKVCVVSKTKSVGTPECVYCVQQALTQDASKLVNMSLSLEKKKVFQNYMPQLGIRNAVLDGCSESFEPM
jgi:hypothetical protein